MKGMANEPFLDKASRGMKKSPGSSGRMMSYERPTTY
jgi:hypothetical protein